jgi:hypothetical protein
VLIDWLVIAKNLMDEVKQQCNSYVAVTVGNGKRNDFLFCLRALSVTHV